MKIPVFSLPSSWRYEGGGEGGVVPHPLADGASLLNSCLVFVLFHTRGRRLPQPKGTPKVEFVRAGMKWIVENQGADQGLVNVGIPDIKHQVRSRMPP